MVKKSNFIIGIFAVMVLVSLAVGIVSAATVTQNIMYQGKLTDAAGNPLTGTYSVTFKMYDVSSGGTALVTDIHSVTAAKGLFTTQITADSSYFDGRALWLGVKVGSDPEMTPRQSLQPVPYAMGLRPGAVITGDAGANPSLKVINTGNNVAALIAGTTGTNSPALFANALGASPAVYASSPNDIGVYGIGKTGAFFTSTQGGPRVPGNPAVNVSTVFDYNPGVRINTSGPISNGGSVMTMGEQSHGVEVATFGRASKGLYAWTSGEDSHGVYAITTGANSAGVYSDSQQSEGVSGNAVSAAGVKGYSTNKAGVWGGSDNDVGVYGIGKEGGYFTTNQAGSAWPDVLSAVNISTLFNNNPGVRINTSGSDSSGVYAWTHGDRSNGVSAETWGDYSQGVYAGTNGPNSQGVFVSTTGRDSRGVIAETSGPNSDGVFAETWDANSRGVSAETWGPDSEGVYAYSMQSEGVVGVAESAAGVKGQSTNKAGIWGISDNDVGLYAMTNRADNKYGIYTPDYLYAKGTQVPAADVAEYMPVSGDFSPGTVLVIGDDGRLGVTSTAYDTRVAGIVSTDPGVSLGTNEDGNTGEAQIAVAGRVPCKVDATYAQIHAGDLLTTSDNPGYAMKATDPKIGTILGKAMGSLESGTGSIEVLVTLQ